MLKIGLTGGIGSGKSTVANYFNQLYTVPIIDADIIARQLVAPQQPALLQLVQLFGSQILTAKGELNRHQLRTLIFTDKQKKKQLEMLLHPLIYQEMQQQFEQQTAPYSLLCIPLLIETQMLTFVDHTLVIDCTIATQIQRVKQRDNLSESQILMMIQSQVSREIRLSYADTIIDNSNSNISLAEPIEKLHNYYLSLSNP